MNTNLDVTYRGRVLLLLGILAAIAAWINKGSSVRLAAAVLLAPLAIDLLWGGIRLPRIRLIMRRRRTESGSPFTESLTLSNLSHRRAIMDLHVREPRTDTYAGGLECERQVIAQTSDSFNPYSWRWEQFVTCDNRALLRIGYLCCDAELGQRLSEDAPLCFGVALDGPARRRRKLIE